MTIILSLLQAAFLFCWFAGVTAIAQWTIWGVLVPLWIMIGLWIFVAVAALLAAGAVGASVTMGRSRNAYYR